MLYKIKNIKLLNRIFKGDSIFFQSFFYGIFKLIEWIDLYVFYVPKLIEAEKNFQVENYLNKVESIWKYAKNNTKFYNTNLLRKNIKPNLSLKAKSPLLTKNQLINKNSLINSVNIKSYNTTIMYSGGTTGAAANFYLDDTTLKFREAEVLLHWRRNGFNAGFQKAIFYRAGVFVNADSKSKSPYRYDLARKILYLSSYYSSEATFKKYYEVIQSWKANFLLGLPSSLYLFALYLKQNSLKISFKYVFSSSEQLFDYQEELFKEVFNCKTIDHYGHGEPGNFCAGRCKFGNYHINPLTSFSEVTSTGKLLETSLINRSQPFIRYEVGDQIEGLEIDGCKCGRKGPFFKKVLGRESEIISLANGKKISSIGFDQIFRGADILEGQIRQTSKGLLKILLVTSKNFNKKSLLSIKQKLIERIGTNQRYKIEIVDYIPRSRNGKFKMIVIEDEND